MKKKGFTLIELMIFVAIIGIVVAIGGGVIKSSLSVSNGTRTGVVVKLSTKGMWVKTNEGQLMIGGVQSGQTWDFTVPKGADAVMELLDSAQKSQKVVTLTYRQVAFSMPWKGDTSYFITKVD